MITIGNSSGDKHKDAVMRLSPIKFMKLMHIYTHFVDVLLNDTSYVRTGTRTARYYTNTYIIFNIHTYIHL